MQPIMDGGKSYQQSQNQQLEAGQLEVGQQMLGDPRQLITSGEAKGGQLIRSWGIRGAERLLRSRGKPCGGKDFCDLEEAQGWQLRQSGAEGA